MSKSFGIRRWCVKFFGFFGVLNFVGIFEFWGYRALELSESSQIVCLRFVLGEISRNIYIHVYLYVCVYTCIYIYVPAAVCTHLFKSACATMPV